MADNIARIVVFVLLVLTTVNLSSQDCEFLIGVELQDQGPCENCMVQLIKLDSISLLDFRHTDSLGYIEFSTSIPDKAILVRASQFGYNDSMIITSCNEFENSKIVFTLRPLAVNIDEVTIIDKIALFNKSGDTTTVNLKALETGAEISVFDIIQRFPGIEVCANEITYHGKKINNILLSDIDVADSDQKQLLENVRYDLINQIQILENQNVKNEIEVDSASLGLKMKINLKEKAQGSFLFGVKGGGGYSEAFIARISVIKVEEKDGLRVETTFNNSYNSMVSPEKESIVHDFIVHELYNSRYKSTFDNTYVDLPSINGIDNRTEKQCKIIYSKNAEYGKFKSINILNNIEGNSIKLQKEKFFLDGLIFNTNQQGHFNNVNLHSLTNITVFTPNKFSASIDLPIRLNYNNDNNSVISIKDFNSLSTNENRRITSIAVNPNYRIEHAKNNTIYRLLGNIGYVNSSSIQNYSSSDSLFDHILINEDLPIFDQSKFTNNFSSEHQLKITHRLSKFDIIFNSILTTKYENLEVNGANLMDTDFTGLSTLNRIGNDNAFFLKYKNKKIHFQSGVKQFWFDQKLNQISAKDYGVNPYIFVMYEISQKWNISSSFDYTTNLPNIYQLTNLIMFKGIQQLQTGGLPVIAQEERKIFNASLFKDFETGENSKQFNFNASYTLPYNVSLQRPVSTSTILQTSWQLIDIRDEMNFNIYYAIYRGKWNFSLRLNSTHKLLKFQNSQYGQLNNSMNTTIKYKSKRVGWQSLLNINDTKIFRIPTHNYRFIYFSNNFTHEHKDFTQTVKCAFVGSSIGTEFRIRPIISIDINYVIHKKNIEISLVGTNINNLKNNFVTSNSSSLQSINITESALQSGDIMIVIKKLF